jgi:hypothetical protein
VTATIAPDRTQHCADPNLLTVLIETNQTAKRLMVFSKMCVSTALEMYLQFHDMARDCR